MVQPLKHSRPMAQAPCLETLWKLPLSFDCPRIVIFLKVGAAADVLCKLNFDFSIQCTSFKSNMGHLEASAAAASLTSLTLLPLCVMVVSANAQMKQQVHSGVSLCNTMHVG